MYEELNAILEALATIQVQLTGLAEQVKGLEEASVEPEPEPEDEPVEYTLEDCVEAAKDLIAAGDPGQVKAALAEAGADRVSNLTGDQITKFMEAL